MHAPLVQSRGPSVQVLVSAHKGAPAPLQMAVILEEYRDVLELVGPPRWLQRPAIPVLARIGRARGLRAQYPHHDEVYARWQQRARDGDLAHVAA